MNSSIATTTHSKQSQANQRQNDNQTRKTKMNAEETKQAAAVMIASETKNIQERHRHGKSDECWVDCPDPDWDWDSFDYRIAPEPEPSILVGPFTELEAGDVSVTFANSHAAIEQLCLKVFGAKPVYASDQPPAPEPMEVEVWVHEDGSICNYIATAERENETYKKAGYILRRATIHPETP